MTDEEYVRARWQLVAAVPTVVNGYVVCAGLSADRQTVLRLWRGPLHECTEAEAWSAARAFTENLERDIAEVQEEIAILNEGVELAASTDADERKYGIPFKRILARLQAVLAELRRGMKEGSE